MKPFTFKNFEISQHQKVFRVGTDGVVLGAIASVDNAQNILEVGTGTGLISLMLAQRNPQAEILALDINSHAVQMASQNFANSPFSERLKVAEQNFNDFLWNNSFDLIISNPPYFEESTSEKDKIARQTIELNFKDLIEKSAALLNEGGVFSVIIPFESGGEFIDICFENKLYLKRKVNVFGIKKDKPKRLVLEFSKHNQEVISEDFIIEKSPRQYSDQYLELTKEFHVFNK